MRRLILAVVLLAAPAHAQDVELELVLLADASGSITQAEIEFQRQGYAAAITSQPVLDAIANTAYQSVAVTYVEWARTGSHDVVVPWTVVTDRETGTAFAGALLPPQRRAFGRNGIGSALLMAKRLIEANDIEGWRRVIDFSGDSANNYNGPAVADARADVLAAGITINGLAILCRDCPGRIGGRGVEERYRTEIIGGRGAFVVTADERASFAEAVRRKLVLEISGRTPDREFVQAAAP